MEEYLPVIEFREGKLLVTGKVDRRRAHSHNPISHATAIIIAILPSGKILVADKTAKQRRKGRMVSEGCHIYDCFGGHMRYEDIPKREHDRGITMETFRECANREFSEELFLVDEGGIRHEFQPVSERLIPVGMYELKNDHNAEYSWVFLYLLESEGNYASEDTLDLEGTEIIIEQPVRHLNWDEMLEMYKNGQEGTMRLSDALGRVLKEDDGRKLYNLIMHELNLG